MKIVSFFFVLFITISSAQNTTVPFSRGVNLSAWLQESDAKQIQFSKYTKADFENIKRLGCDVIRLPINMHEMTSGEPDYTIDPLLIAFLNHAVDWAEELQLHIILDNHSFDPAVNTTGSVFTILVPVWKQIAEQMKNRSSLVYYEILNEPHGISDIVWNAIQKNVIDSIRSVDSVHTIIIGPANWNSLENLSAMPIYSDTNLIYTFHFYEPFIFTHQGASWSDPSMVPLSGVPYPYDAGRMPLFPTALAGTWIQNVFNGYSSTGTNGAVQNLINKAVAFRTSRNVPLYCGEFGVYIPNSANEDRVRWYSFVRSYFEQYGIAWTSWDYQGGFGLFEAGTDEMFDYDLNIPLINALGFNAPPQKNFTVVPDSAAFDLYRDFAGANLLMFGNGAVTDFYSTANPAEGTYCIRFGNAPQYESIRFDFRPTKDLSVVKNNGYVLEFNVRSTVPTLQFDIRFIDTKSGPLDHPWRMRKTINSTIVPWDGAWHRLRIPLNTFSEHGSWDGTWYNPIGAFNWKEIDNFEIVSEQSDLFGKELFIDDIRIVPLTPAFAAEEKQLPDEFKLYQNFPNPFNPSTTFQYQLPRNSHVSLQIYNVLGQVVETLVDEQKVAGTYRVQWTANLSGGVYYCRFQADKFVQTGKLLLLK